MQADDPHFSLRLATSEADLRAAQRLRYEVFIAELGGDGPLVDHVARLERDAFDPLFDHLILADDRRAPGDHVVGVYRMLPGDRAAAMGRFYCDDEYDLSALRSCGRKLLELGRSCVHRDYRGSAAMFHLWTGLAEYVLERDIEILFGVASFHGTDTTGLQQPLAYLHHYHLAPPPLRVRAKASHFQRMDLLTPDQIDRRTAVLALPPLVKAYLRLGGVVGEGAFIDTAFNTVDVCLLMDADRMSERHRAYYIRNRAAQ